MAPSRSLRSKAKQTRLEFQPLSPSAPVKQSYTSSIQDRLANVRFRGSKPRLKSPPCMEDDRQSLPTPQATSPAGVDLEVTRVSSPLSSLRTSPALPPRFVAGISDTSSDDDEIIPPSSKRRKYSNTYDPYDVAKTKSAIEGTSARRATTLRLARPTSETSHRKFSSPTRRSTRLANGSSSPLRLDSRGSSQRALSIDIPNPSKPLSNIASPETSDDDDDVIVTQPTVKRRGITQSSKKQDVFIVNDDEIQYITSEEEQEASSRNHKRQHGQDGFVADNNPIEYVTSEEEPIRRESSSKSRKPSYHQKPPSTPSQRQKQRSRRVQNELAEDLLDLQGSESDQNTRESRTRGGPVNTQRDKTREHFELLKRRRAGAKPPRVIDSDSEDLAGTRSGSDGVDIDNIGREPNEIEISSDGSAAIADNRLFDERAYLDEEDDFIVEDQATAGRLGRPNNDIPLQFTSFASAKPKELFPHIIEWMVKNKISPAFSRHDDVYTMSFARIDDQVKAQAGSRLISSAWGAMFKNAILARPGMHVAASAGNDEDLIRTCDACNRSNHPARYEFTFSGKAYHKDSLEPVDELDSDDEDSDNIEKVSYDEQGHALADQNMCFYLGRFCAANADMGHKLTHWKHHLNGQVLSYLEEQGVLSAEAVVKREKQNKKKREKEAENIVDMMQETGMIAELWQGFQDDLEDAKIGMEGHESKGGRSKGRIGSVRVQRDNRTVGEWNEGGKYRQLPIRLESDSEGE